MRALLDTSDKEPENEECDSEETEGEGGYLVPVGHPLISLRLGLELSALNNPLHHLMAEEVGIVKVLSLLWLAKVCEVVSFLVVHRLFLDWLVGRLPSPLVFRWLVQF